MRAVTRMQADRELNDATGTPSAQAGEPRRTASHASRGQIIIMFAIALIGLIGMLGMATDLGYAFVQRRTMQNSADAGAIAGAHTILISTTASPLIVLGNVQQIAYANKTGSAQPVITRCQYVNDQDTELNPCSKPVPTGATGVHVTVSETHSTFFIRLIPGGPKTISTSGSATAHVQKLKNPPSDGPFLVCGVGTKTTSNGSGSTMDILQQPVNGVWTVNPNAVTTATHPGPTFQVYGPNVSTCNAHDSSYKGLALGGPGSANASLQPPNWFNYTSGTTTGQLSANVQGVNGCQKNVVINCVAFLPVAVNQPAETSNTNHLWTVMILPFYITSDKSNSNYRNGQLLGDYVVEGAGDPNWNPSYQGTTVIRLTK